MHSTKPLVVYSVLDAAYDAIEMERDSTRYMRTRDPELVKFVPGIEPTKFYVNRIDSDAFNALVQSQPTDHMQAKESFRLSVSRIENLVSQKTGQTIRVFKPSDTRRISGNLIPSLSDDDLLHIAPCFLQEIGGVAFTRSFLPVSNVAFYQLPPTLLAAYTARLHCLAVAAIDKARSLEQSPKSKKSAPAARESTAKSGAKATAATATGKATKRKGTASKRRSRSSKT
jgi:hypothetical protein